jgi:hypothetical protein
MKEEMLRGDTIFRLGCPGFQHKFRLPLKIKAQQRSTEESVSLLDPHPSDLASV